jgi:hypothetical protein
MGRWLGRTAGAVAGHRGAKSTACGGDETGTNKRGAGGGGPPVTHNGVYKLESQNVVQLSQAGLLRRWLPLATAAERRKQ